MSREHKPHKRENRLLRLIFGRKVKRAGQKVQDGVDLFEAATVNRDHPRFPKSERKDLGKHFLAAAGFAAIGFGLSAVTRGPLAILGLAGLAAAKFTMIRAGRVLWEYDPANPAKFSEHPLRAAADLFEAASVNFPHPLLKPSSRSSAWSKLAVSVPALAVGMGLDYMTTGPLSLAGMALVSAAGFLSYRWYRAIAPYRHVQGPKTPAQAPGGPMPAI